MMRIWLVENRSDGEASGLEAALRRLEAEGTEGHNLVAVRQLTPLLIHDLRENQIDALIIADRAWPDEFALPGLAELDVAVLVATSAGPAGWFGALAETHSVWFVPPRATVETLRLALKGLWACQNRRSHWKIEIAGLRQRLNDRIVIERAKGILSTAASLVSPAATPNPGHRPIVARYRSTFRSGAQRILSFRIGTDCRTAR
jgi:hypothetical protein